MVNCIICDNPNEDTSIEHIVPESFGNTFYTMKKGEVCNKCNNLFSKFENKALTNSIFIIERARFGTKTKKGKVAKGKIEELQIEGHQNFKKGHIYVKGIDKENFKNYNSKNKTGQLFVQAFDKSESAVSKFLLMVGIEALFTSQKKVYEKCNFENLKKYLTNKENKDWCFVSTNKLLEGSISIPTFLIKHRLNKIKCQLKIIEKSENILLFNFKFGGVSMIINLLNRDLEWVNEVEGSLFPEHFRRKIKTTEKDANANGK